LREQQSRRNENKQKSIEPANHACLTVGSGAGARASRSGLTTPRHGSNPVTART